MKRLSATQLKTYRRCPQQWKLKYVDRLPEEPKPFLNLGTAVHSALETMFDRRVAEPASREEMLEAFDEAFDPEAYPTDEERERRRADGERMVREFHEKHADDFRPPLAVEKRLDFELEGARFTGYLDRIDKVDDDRIRIVDYKTGGSFDLDRVRTEMQLTLYQVGAEEKLGMEVDSLVLYHVPSQTPFEVERHPPERVEELRQVIREVVRGIEDEEFEPDPGHYCQWCDFQPHCPAYADEYPENWPADDAEDAAESDGAVPSPEEAARLADRYGELRETKSEVTSELDQVKEALKRYFERTGTRAVAGDACRVKASRRETWRIDDDEALREILDPQGLWDTVLVTKVDWREKAALPDDPSIPDDVRERVRDLARKKVVWRLSAKPVDDGEE